MKYVVVYTSAEGGAAGAPTHFPAHQAHYQRFHAQGTLLMIGPFADDQGEAMGVFTTREAAEAFVRDDPFIEHGVVGRWEIREWNEVLA